MLKASIIGIGNAGGQVAALAKEKLNISAVAINSSETDLSTISDSVPKKLIKCSDGTNIQGAGQNRDMAISMLRDSITELCSDNDINEIMMTSDIVFVVSSAGGGTGSGTAPTFVNVLNKAYPDTKVILIGIQPVIESAGSAIFNAKQYSEEVCNVIDDITYMMYDNTKVANTKIPSYAVLKKVNEDIVEDIKIIMGFYNTTTQYDSIDDQDDMRLINNPGYMTVASVRNIKEKDLDGATIEDMIIDQIKRNSHVDLQRDRLVNQLGVISHLSEAFAAEFDTNVPKVREFIGEPPIRHTHTVINENRADENYVMLILTGCSDPIDQFTKLDERMQEINEAQNRKRDDYSYTNTDQDKLSEKMFNVGKNMKVSKDITANDLDSIFSKVRH